MSSIKQDNFASTKNEAGRSMVEMLATLALVGVLSLVGITGYRWSLEKNEVNNVSMGLDLARVTIISSMSSNNKSSIYAPKDIETSDASLTNSTYKTIIKKNHGLDRYNPVAVACNKNDFDIALYNIKSNVCRELLTSMTAKSKVDVHLTSEDKNYDKYCLRTADVNQDCGDDTEVRMIFSFDVDENKIPGFECLKDSDCRSNACVKNVCRACSHDEVIDINGDCQPCSDRIISNVEITECETACGGTRFYNDAVWYIRTTCTKKCGPGLFGGNENCYACDMQLDVYDSTESQCNTCGDLREWRSNMCAYMR